MSNNALIIAKLALSLQESIINKEFEGKSPIAIVTKGMELINDVPELLGATKKNILIKVIERIAAGKDNVLGTEDDLLSKDTIEIFHLIVDNHIIDGIIDVVVDASKGKFHIGKAAALAQTVASSSVVPKCFEKCFPNSKGA